MKRRAAVVALVLAAGCQSAPDPVPEPAPTAVAARPKARSRSRPRPKPQPRPRAPSPEEIALWDKGVRAFFLGEQDDLRDCYERELRRVEEEAVLGAYRNGEPVPNLAGSVVLAVPVEADGSVKLPRLVEDRLENANVARCLVEKARRWHLPPPPTGEPVEFEIPLRFQLMGG